METKSLFQSITQNAGYVLVLVILICYGVSINYGYVLDDHSVILKHSQVQEGWSGIPSLLTHNYRYGNNAFNDGLYRPLSLVSFAVEHSISPQNPRLSHALNLLFFSLGILFLYKSLRVILAHNNKLVVPLICLLFITHPLHTEVMFNIKARDELFAFLGFSVALYSFFKYLTSKKISFLVYGLIAFVFALFSKESAVSFCFVIPLLLYLHPELSLKKVGKLALILVPISIAFLALHAGIISSMENPIDPGAFGLLNNPIAVAESNAIRWASTFSLQLLFLSKMAFIGPLLHDYSYAEIDMVTWSNWKAILGLLIFIALAAASAIGVLKRKKAGLIAALYLVCIAVPSQFAKPIGTIFAERLLFMAILPFAMALVLGLDYLLHKLLKWKSKTILPAILLAVITCYAVISIARGKDWESNYSLYSADYKKTKKSARIAYNYGSESFERAIREPLVNKKQMLFKESIQALSQAIQIYPEYSDAYNNLALSYGETKQYQEALKIVERGKRVDPNYQKFDYLAGIFYINTNQFQNAIISLNNYLSFKPEDANALFLLGKTYGSIQDFDQAILALKQSLALDQQNPEVFSFLGMAYGINEEPAKGIQLLEQAKQLFPSNENILFNLSLAYGQAGLINNQQQTLQRLLQINPNHVAARNHFRSGQSEN